MKNRAASSAEAITGEDSNVHLEFRKTQTSTTLGLARKWTRPNYQTIMASSHQGFPSSAAVSFPLRRSHSVVVLFYPKANETGVELIFCTAHLFLSILTSPSGIAAVCSCEQAHLFPLWWQLTIFFLYKCIFLSYKESRGSQVGRIFRSVQCSVCSTGGSLL